MQSFVCVFTIKSNDSIDKIERFIYNKKGNCKLQFRNKKRRDDGMSITATELKVNLGKYLLLAETEDIYITRNGKVVAKLSNPYQDRVDVAKSLFGVLPTDMTLEEAQEERRNKI
jgi:antitoxin (DNA-binding transcriptional repressor) of toxin-antitoxin stability system